MERVVSRSQKNSNAAWITMIQWDWPTSATVRSLQQYATTVALKHQQGHIMRQHLLNAAEPG